MSAEVTPIRHPHGQVAGLLTAVLVAVGLFSLLGSIANATAGEHVFNAKLSLTGDCSVSAKIDAEPDPGCPGGAHPPQPFSRHAAVAVDPHGNRYVASTAVGNNGGRVDVFTSAGEFITQVQVALPELRGAIAVDSQGNLYVLRRMKFGDPPEEALVRFEPTQYNPAAGDIAYDPTPVVVSRGGPGEAFGVNNPAVAVNPVNDHVLVMDWGTGVVELNSAAEGNTVVGIIHLEGIEDNYRWANTMALDATRSRIYVTDLDRHPSEQPTLPIVKAFDLSSPADPEEPRELLYTLDGTTTPTNRFVSETRVLPLAVDESNGHLFVGDMEAPTARIYEFDTAGEPVGTIEGRLGASGAFNLQLAHDNSATSPTQGYLFVPSGSNPGRSLAYGPPPPIGPPIVGELSFSNVTTSDAILRGLVNPEGLETDWRLEYTTEQSFLANGFEGAALAGEGTLEPADFELAVSAAATGLSPGTSYRFRLVAENEEGEDEAEAGFSTYALPDISSDCPNQALRTGPSAGLPDCRAYELVTPTNTNGRAPQMLAASAGGAFPSPIASPAGDAVSFAVEGTVLPGFDGTANLTGDPYLARRGQKGWKTESTGPSGAFSEGVLIGSPSADQGHLAWATDGQGPGRLEGTNTAYVRYPDGRFELAGKGSLATDPGVAVRLISANGAHVIFDTGGEGAGKKRQLEPNAPPNGTDAIYDRTADGTLHVVSLLAGEITPGAGQNASFKGASLDGRGVAFTIAGTLYLRYDNEETFEIGAGVGFAGLAEGGARLFYTEGGDLHRFDAEDQSRTPFSESGDVTVVNVAADGSAAYFVSPSVLDPDPNPTGDTAQAGQENLWLSREGQISFVGTVSQRDVEGKKVVSGPEKVRGLGLWTDEGDLDWNRLSRAPSRSTPDGAVLLFESNAPLTDYDPEEHTQIYRYDSRADTLRCLSCNPTGVSDGDATLKWLDDLDNVPLKPTHMVANLSLDGDRAFFESTEALVAADVDGLRDVYEWEEEGTGSCRTAGGCLYLISAGNSARDDYIWGVSRSGADVFILSGDLLAPAFDQDETASIYTARVNGGFAPPQAPAGECLGEACQPAARAPEDPTPTSSIFRGAGNMLEPARSCAPAARRAKRLGRVTRKLRRAAKRSGNPTRSRKLHRRANRAGKRAKRQRANTRRCRLAGKRANADGRAGR